MLSIPSFPVALKNRRVRWLGRTLFPLHLTLLTKQFSSLPCKMHLSKFWCRERESKSRRKRKMKEIRFAWQKFINSAFSEYASVCCQSSSYIPQLFKSGIFPTVLLSSLAQRSELVTKPVLIQAGHKLRMSSILFYSLSWKDWGLGKSHLPEATIVWVSYLTLPPPPQHGSVFWPSLWCPSILEALLLPQPWCSMLVGGQRAILTFRYDYSHHLWC